MDETILTALAAFGLTEKETAVYLATLKLGSSKVHDIAHEANTLRETTYAVLESLSQKGIVSFVYKEKKKFYEAAGPQKLQDILREKQQFIIDATPRLQAIMALVPEKPYVKVFEGREGLKTAINTLIEVGEPISVISSTGKLLEELNHYFPNYITRRVEAKIPIRVLTEHSSLTEDIQQKDRTSFREIRFLPDNLGLPNAVFVYGKNVLILNLGTNLSAVLLEGSSLHVTFSKLFELLWATAPKEH